MGGGGRQTRKDDHIIWVQSTVNLVPDEAGQPHRIFAINRDVSAHRQAAEEVRRLRAVLDATPFPVALVDRQDEQIHDWSRSALELFGHTAPTAPEWYQLAYPDPAYRNEVVAR